jgi:hypothetical protein
MGSAHNWALGDGSKVPRPPGRGSSQQTVFQSIVSIDFNNKRTTIEAVNLYS